MSDRARREDHAALADLLGRVAAGEPAALAPFYEATAPHLYGVAVRLLGDDAAAEDVLQEVYVDLWQHGAPSESAAIDPLRWMTALVRHRSLDRRGAAGEAMPSEGHPAARIHNAAPLDDAATAHDATVRAGSGEALALAFHQGLSPAQIARHLHVSRRTARDWIRAALAGLPPADSRGTA